VQKMQTMTKAFFSYLLAIVLVAFGTGCGIKGPPVPLKKEPPPQVADLEARLEGDRVILVWGLGKEGEEIEAIHFVVMRHCEPAHNPECPACPKRFVKAGQVDAPTGVVASEHSKLSFAENIKPEMRCSYKVYPVSARGLIGPESPVKSVTALH
jgi:predicted small lipoprotein YifL